jgi:AraC-like DNA-binding protein
METVMTVASTQGSPPEPPPARATLFEDRFARIGTFRATPEHPEFEDSGPSRAHVVVFPRNAVWIEPEGATGFVADPNIITYYNRGQLYRRRAVDPEGDDCVWIAPASSMLEETLGALGFPTSPTGPFSWHHGLADAESYLLQVGLVQYLESESVLDPQAVEEAVLGILGRLLTAKAHEQGRSTPGQPIHQRELVERTKELINRRFDEPLTISDVALEVACSPYHLSRLFRARTGLPIAAYRNHIRLRTALLRLHDSPDLTDLALDLGYSSHSHFTTAFSDLFGVAPSVARRDWSPKRLKGLLKRLDPRCRQPAPRKRPEFRAARSRKRRPLSLS